jgi:hypothetical protein
MKKYKDILQDDKAPITALLYAITKLYGSECYEWDPLVLKAELQEEHSCEISDLQSDKIQAGLTILTTDHYEISITVFETVNYLLNHQLNHLDELNPLEAEELICGLTEAYLIRGESLKFSPEIRVYAGKIFWDYGFHKPPKLFPEAIMEEREGDDSEKNEAFQELFNEKINKTTEYLEKCTT